MHARTRVPIALLVATASAGAATQMVAAAFSFQNALGEPAAMLGRQQIYWPWSVWEWRERWGDLYPKPFAIADALAITGVALAVLIIVVTDDTRRRPAPFGKRAWADFEEGRAAGLFATSGTILGKLNGEILCFAGDGHQLLVGASRSGKGRGHVVPTLLAWPHSALVLDVKGELADGDTRLDFPGTAGFRERLGPVLRFAPTRPNSIRFNPLFEVRLGKDEVRDVQNIVEIIVDPAGDGRHQDFWDRSAKQVLTGLILHVLYAEPSPRKTLAVVRAWLADLDNTAKLMRRTLHRRNPQTGKAEVHPEVLHAAESYLSGEERLRSSVKATAESFFGLFADPLVAEKTSTSDFRIGDLMCRDKPVTLYLQPPPSDAQRLMPLMRLMINQIARALMESQTHDARGLEKKHPLLLALDEFPQLGRMPFFETAMGAMAGYGLKAYLVCQSLNHIVRAYGRDNVILDNCAAVTAFAAADMDTAKRIAEMAGEVWEIRPQDSEQRPRALIGPRRGSTTYREERRPLLLPGDVRQLKRDEQLIFVSGMKPLRAKKLKFDREKVFASRLLPSSHASAAFEVNHDWSAVAPVGFIETKKPVALSAAQPKRPSKAAEGQGDLFVVVPPKTAEKTNIGAPPPAAAPTTPHPRRDAGRSRSMGI